MKVHKQVNSDKAPKALGPYSHAVVAGSFLFSSGQIGIDPKTGLIPEGIEAQTLQVIQNLSSVLEEAGTSLRNVVKTTVFLLNMDDFAAMNRIYADFFTEKPARSTVGVKSLPRNVLVEIECIALIP